jgi:menaquinone-dependent protoporphyrinogen IX oxidase
MSIDRDTFILFCLFILYIGGDIYTANVEHKKLDKHIRENDAFIIGSSIRLQKNEDTADSLRKQINALAKSVVYIDSCNQAKTLKQEKAERRGRFVGGLLKGLFPGM